MDFDKARDDMLAVVSAGPYINHLHFVPAPRLLCMCV